MVRRLDSARNKDGAVVENLVDHLRNCRSGCAVVLVLWHVVVLGAARLLEEVPKGSMVSDSSVRVLVRELLLLLLCVPSASDSTKQGADMRTVFRFVLVTCWSIVFGAILLTLAAPEIAATLLRRFRHIQDIRFFLIVLTIASIAHGISWLYRKGMRASGTRRG